MAVELETLAVAAAWCTLAGIWSKLTGNRAAVLLSADGAHFSFQSETIEHAVVQGHPRSDAAYWPLLLNTRP
jgi:hypothetical protein